MSDPAQACRRTFLLAAALSPAASLVTAVAATAAPAESGLTVIAEVVAKPEYAGQIRAAMNELTVHARSETGCLHYALYEDVGALGHFYTFERWTDGAALDAHLNSPAMKAAGPKFANLLAQPPMVHRLATLNA